MDAAKTPFNLGVGGSALEFVRPNDKNIPHVAACVQNPDNLDRRRFVAVDDQVGIHQEEAVSLIRQILTPVSDSWVPCFRMALCKASSTRSAAGRSWPVM
jgi:hypothetical protein